MGQFIPPPQIEGRIIIQYPFYIIVDKEKNYHNQDGQDSWPPDGQGFDNFEPIDDWTAWSPVRDSLWLDNKVAIGFKNKEDRLTFVLKYIGEGNVETN